MIQKSMIILTLLSISLSADSVDKMIDDKQSANAKSQVTQKNIDKYSEKSENLYEDYLLVKKELEEQTIYNKQLTQITQAQKKELPQLQKQIQDIEVTNRKIVPLMFEMVEKLDRFVSIDTVFLKQEREDRVNKLKSYLSNPNMSTAEQFRTILESYKIEYGYSRTLEVYRSELIENNTSKTVDFLRIGRVALYYQTIDSTESGYYDLQSGKWIVLDKKYNEAIKKAINIARKKLSPDFLTLPILSAKAAI